MKKQLIFNLLLFIAFALSTNVSAQNQLWKKVPGIQPEQKRMEGMVSLPSKYDLMSLKVNELKTKLQKSLNKSANTEGVIISLPVGEGKLQHFRLRESSIFSPGLQSRYPGIRSYSARGIDDPTASARLSFSDYTGLNGIIVSGKHPTVYIDPYTQDKESYIIYRRNEYHRNTEWECLTGENNSIEKSSLRNPLSNDSLLRTYRLALACTGEYAQYHLNRLGIPPNSPDEVKKAAVLSEMNAAMTRVNEIYEKDMAIRMILIDSTDKLIYLNGNSDPYSNFDGFTMLDENQTTCDAVIGDANYDIGHVFSTGGGGVAYLDAPCVSGTKAKGVTGLSDPIDDAFYIDYVAHEMGHQFGANHTFNGSLGSCEGNRNDDTAMEPGSGSTIMAYAGICDIQDVQSHSDAYFHAISIQEINENVTNGQALCSVNLPLTNTAPTVDAGEDYIIPKSTAFALRGSASDLEGDSLTYCWEQMDPQISIQPPLSDNPRGPVFRTFLPVASPERYFPRLSTIIGGETSWEWEVVPSVGRKMKFRMTARDNAPGGGGTGSDDMKVEVTAKAGPFIITSQNIPVTWGANGEETINWDVANTDLDPVNCTGVDIFFSYDGGYTYSDTLALNVPNTGSAVIQVPSQLTTTGRVMVKGANNIFLDINNSDIKIAPLCDGIPFAGNVPDTIKGCPGKPIVLESTGATSDVGGIKFQWETRPDSTRAWTEIPEANSTTITLVGDTISSAYRLRAICTGSQDTVYSGSITYILNPYTECYCTSAIDKNVEPISLVDFAGIHNESDPDINESPGYEDFTAVSGEVEQGRKYPIIVKGNTDGSNLNRVIVYFDWNHDGEFEGTDEKYSLSYLSGSNGIDNKESNGTILIPKNAKTGLTRMRVVKKLNNSKPIVPCGLLDRGQIEDYSIIVNELNCNTVSTTITVNTPCEGDTLRLSATGDGTFEWKGPSEFSSTLQNPIITLVSSSDAGTYSLNYTEYTGCQVSAAVEVSVLPGVQGAIETLERGDSSCIAIVNIISGTGPFSYLWSNGDADSIATTLPKGEYTVTVTGANGCSTILAGSCYGLATHKVENTPLAHWPNPTIDKVIFDPASLNLSQVKIQVTDFFGRPVSDYTINTVQNCVDLRRLPSGMYVITTLGESGIRHLIRIIKI
jgi:hypothetical protein